MTPQFGALDRAHRDGVRDILHATAVFRAEEVNVALELFDEAGEDYELVGTFGDDDRLDGYACFGPTPSTDRTFDLYWIAVHPRAQGVGIGSRLLAEVERRLRERAARLLVVETSSRQEYAPTRRFYESRGYHATACIGDFYAPGDDRVIFTKRFT